MNRSKIILMLGILLFVLSGFAIVKSNSYDLRSALSTRKCSAEIEGLKFCAESSKITVTSGEPVYINFTWSNSSDVYRHAGISPLAYSVIVKSENGEKVNTIYQQKEIDKQKRIENNTSTEEDKTVISHSFSGSGRSIRLAPGEALPDRIVLTGDYFNYELANKGRYYVTVSRSLPSLESGKTIEFVIDDIEIQVK